MNVLPQNFEQQLRDEILRKIETLDPEQCKVLLKYLVKTNYPSGIASALSARNYLGTENLSYMARHFE